MENIFIFFFNSVWVLLGEILLMVGSKKTVRWGYSYTYRKKTNNN